MSMTRSYVVMHFWLLPIAERINLEICQASS